MCILTVPGQNGCDILKCKMSAVTLRYQVTLDGIEPNLKQTFLFFGRFLERVMFLSSQIHA